MDGRVYIERDLFNLSSLKPNIFTALSNSKLETEILIRET